MDTEPEQIFHQRGHTEGQQTYEKMLNITNYQSGNYNHNELSPHTCQNTTSVGEDVERCNSHVLQVRMQTSAATMESSMEFPQKIKNVTAL